MRDGGNSLRSLFHSLDFEALTRVGIFALDIKSPIFAAKHWEGWDRPAQPNELPELRAFSDIVMGYYLRNNPDPRKLRVCLVQTVLNDDTLAIVSRPIDGTGSEEIYPWPGNSFSTTTDARKALLGTMRNYLGL